jgi:hypothetical protein
MARQVHALTMFHLVQLTRTADVNYTCLVRDTDSKLDNVNTAHQATGGENTDKRGSSYPEPASYDNSHTQSATYRVTTQGHATTPRSRRTTTVYTHEPSYDNNAGPADVAQQQETVRAPYYE